MCCQLPVASYVFSSFFFFFAESAIKSTTGTTFYLSIFPAIVGLTLTHRFNAVRGLRTGSKNSGAGDYIRGEQKRQKTQ